MLYQHLAQSLAQHWPSINAQSKMKQVNVNNTTSAATANHLFFLTYVHFLEKQKL